MGAGSSKGILTASELLSKTQNTRDTIENIFRFLKDKMRFQDYLALANEGQCKNYVILLASSLETTFDKLRFRAGQTKDGYIYFHKISDGKTIDPETKLMCMIIAYYYIRIFQVYGALALTVLDVNTRLYTIGGGDDDEEDMEFEQEGGAELALRDSDKFEENFKILRPYLRRSDQTDEYYKFHGVPIFLAMNPISESGVTKYKILYEFRNPNPRSRKRDLHLTAKLRIDLSRSKSQARFFFEDIEGTKKSVQDVTFAMQKGTGVTDQYTLKGETIPSVFQRAFSDFLRKGDGPSSGRGEDDDDENNDRNEERRTKRYEDYRYNFFGTDKDRRDREEDKSLVRESLRTKALQRQLVDQFTTNPMKAHCVARGLQLLSSRGMEKEFPKEIYSSICSSKFLMSKGKQSLPGPEEHISNELGLFTLNQLFYDKVVPEMGSDMTANAKAKQAIFLDRMQKVFHSSPGVFNDLRNKTASQLCASIKDKDYVRVNNKEVITKLRLIVKKMMLYQIEHTAKVMMVLQKMFIIRAGKPFGLHPTILNGGIAAVNKVAEEARNLLVEYYSNCEFMYGAGVQVLQENKATLRS
jgi:hypothetical protein